MSSHPDPDQTKWRGAENWGFSTGRDSSFAGRAVNVLSGKRRRMIASEAGSSQSKMSYFTGRAHGRTSKNEEKVTERSKKCAVGGPRIQGGVQINRSNQKN